MEFFKNSKGREFQRGAHGCYPANDGDPQNGVEFDEDEDPDAGIRAQLDFHERYSE